MAKALAPEQWDTQPWAKQIAEWKAHLLMHPGIGLKQWT